VRVFLLTDTPSPYQVEVLNQIARDKDLELHVGYLRQTDPDRKWSASAIEHQSIMLDDGAAALATASELVNKSDLVIFNYYRHPRAEHLIAERAKLRRPWCFWGERPGLKKPEWVGRLVRSWKLRWLHSSAAPIWGVGEFALKGYKDEFGSGHAYFNFPYFSNLKRFSDKSSNGTTPVVATRTFLFSGSLISRKGIDLVARAFMRLLAEGHDVRLKVVGEGELRSAIETILNIAKSNVEFVGFVDWDNLPALYASSQVMCVPSRYDGWGLVVPEGLAAGLPVIATDRMGSAVEFIESGKNGWRIPADDEDAILNAMREAATLSSSKLAELARNARESVREHSLEHGASRFKLYANEAIASWQ
jgi:glycosyltransferase involved in cell wall biosynthesis